MSPPLDPQVWKACAGSAAKIPEVGSLVYYFPQGHADQASSLPDLSSISSRPLNPLYLCWVSAVSLLANPNTDEVFAQIRLDPRISSPPPPEPSPEDRDVVAFAKILTPSDANNGGGFSVPRFCADSNFPPLDYNADTPVQTISVTDVHGIAWEFRHIYRGAPRRHLLTTGWSKFVNSKKLVAGDSVVFVKNRVGEIFVGIRRTGRSCGAAEYLPEKPNLTRVNGFSRNVRGRVPAESVVEAVRLAKMDRPFEVLYYPKAGSPAFVVAKEVVGAALAVSWTVGMRVRMSVKTEDSATARMTWFQGTVSSAEVQDSVHWLRSPWRMLQVTWDELGVLPNLKTVSPWQVELVSGSPQMHSPQIQMPYPTAMKKLKVPHCLELSGERQGSRFFPTEKLKVPYCLELSGEGQGNMFFPTTGFNSTKMGSRTSSLSDYDTFPAGMQGARHDFCVSTLSSFVPRNTNMFFDNPHGISLPHKLDILPSESTSSLSQESIHHHGMEMLDAASCIPTRKANKGSFQLFGQIIHMEHPNDNDADKKNT